MQIIEFKEQEHFTFWHFKNMFRNTGMLNEDKLRDVLKRLELSHCLKHHIPVQDIPDDIEVDMFSETNNEYYKFTFVGIIMVKSFAFLVYPKYWRETKKEVGKVDKFTQILAVIDKYNRSNKASGTGADTIYGESRLSNLIHLLQDYLSSGLYSNEEALIEINGEGQILWERTIDESSPYMNNGVPVYLDMHTQINILDESDIIRRLHAAIITEVGNEIDALLDYINLGFDFHLTDESVSDFGTNDYLLYLLDRELSRQFITKKQTMLANMKHYIEESDRNPDDSVQLYGTTNFNLVWEEVCAEVYRNSLDMDMNSLGLHKVFSDEKLETNNHLWGKLKLSNYVEKPLWIHAGKKTEAQGTLILDVLEVDTEAKVFKIFDAKYYQINFKENVDGRLVVSGQPGVGDITKQYLYQLAYKELAEENDYKFSNGFVIPKDDLIEEELVDGLGQGQLLGEAKMQILSNLGLVDITVIGRDCYTIFKQYLQY
ncbi:hypothetical protein IGJ66_002395 [Enterococcus sp. DIV0176]|uniref:LlaJI family restriction endonuclease n=1 Tax=Enterococcus sp. DIV0176 TaxID=2774758 RepID=UPI003D30048F